MSPAVVNGLVLSLMALLTLLLAVSVAVVIQLPPAPTLNDAARQTLDNRIAEFGDELRDGAGARARAREQTEISKEDVRAEYRERRVRKTPRALQGVTRYRTIVISTASFIFALPVFPHFLHLSPGHKTLTDSAGAAVATIGFFFDGSEFARATFKFRRKSKNSERTENELRLCRERLDCDIEKEARRWAGETEITPDDVSKAWGKLVKSRAAPPAIPIVRSRKASVLHRMVRAAEIIAVAGILYFGSSLVTRKLPTGQYWPFAAIIAALFIFYLALVNGPRAIAGAWKHRRGLVTIASTLGSGLWGSLAWLARKARALAGSLFRTRRKDRVNAGKEEPTTTESTSGRDNGVGIDMASQDPKLSAGDRNQRRTSSGAPGTVREIQVQVRDMRKAAMPFLKDEARRVYWDSAWELSVIHAAARAESSRRQSNSLRLTAIISAIIVPALVGLGLSGVGGDAVQWLTFGLSLIVALSTAIIIMFRLADRCLMYRALSESLMSTGWILVNSPATDQAWARFTAATDAAKARYNTSYHAAVIHAVQQETGDRSSGNL